MRLFAIIMFISSLAIGCTNKGKPCPSDGCGDGLNCELMTNICQAKCAKPNDCEQGLTCDEEANACYDPVLRKELEAKIGNIEMIKIPSGSFKMGSEIEGGLSNDKPVHRVYVNSFYMSKTEVTVRQYRDCVQTGGCSTDGLNKSDVGDWRNKQCNWNKSGRDNHPINCVDWNQARRFAKWAGGDLPSEAQWEYAARGGQGNRYKYAGSNDADKVAWYGEKMNRGSTHPVGQKKKNGYGLFDLSGNVGEWTLDKHHDNYDGAPTDGTAWTSGGSSRCVVRGGGFSSGEAFASKISALLVAARRSSSSPSYRDSDLGFRIVRNEN